MEKILLSYLKANKGIWFKKVSLYVLADESGYSPETCGRALRDLAKEGLIKVEYYKGTFAKNLAKYSYDPTPKQSRFTEVLKDNGERVMQMI